MVTVEQRMLELSLHRRRHTVLDVLCQVNDNKATRYKAQYRLYSKAKTLGGMAKSNPKILALRPRPKKANIIGWRCNFSTKMTILRICVCHWMSFLGM